MRRSVPTLVACLALVIVACSSSTTSTPTSDAGTASDADTSPPDDGSSDAAAPSTGGPMAFIVNRIFIGETDRAGEKKSDAWKAFGRNIDGLVTTVTDPKSPDLALVCKRQTGSPATTHDDGNAGIDNAWGKYVLPLLDPYSPSPSRALTEAIAAGRRSAIISVDGKIGSWLYGEKTAKIVAGDVAQNGVYDSGMLEGEASIELGPELTVALRSARIVMTIAPDASAVSEGTISGVVDTEELVAAARKSGHYLSPELCSGTTVDTISDSIRQASDILRDGTQDPTKVCDGLSVGIGFTATRIVVGSVAPAPAPAPDPCQ